VRGAAPKEKEGAGVYGLACGSFTVTDAADACGGDSPHPVTASAVAIPIKNLKAPLLRVGILSPTES